jgi:Flp pilus assembly protein TadD
MAIKHNPKYSLEYNGKGACLDELNRQEEAIASYDMALKHNPNNVTIINNRKLLLEKLNSK